MNEGLLALIAALPIISIFILMVALKWPATKAMPIAFLITLILAIFIWQTPWSFIFASSLNGLVITFEILLIVFGALALLFTLRESGALAVINEGFTKISPDRRIQVIIIAWFFGGFIEGAAGFGTPAALAAPLLLSLGFPALAAVMLSLIANGASANFGAVGTPVTIGIGNSLEIPMVIEELKQTGSSFGEFMQDTVLYTAIIQSVSSLLIPLIMVALLTRFFGEKKTIREGLEVWPYALLAGFCFMVPYVLVAWLLGPEFPTLVGGLAGLAILIPLTKAGFLKPKKIWDFPAKESWDKTWTGSIAIKPEYNKNKIPFIKAWIPYALIVIILALTRINELPFMSWLKSVKIELPEIFDTTVNISLSPLYVPGVFPFLFIALLCIPLFAMNKKKVKSAWKESLQRAKSPLIALIFAIPLVRIMMISGENPGNIDGMPIAMANYLADVFQGAFPFVSPFIGALGSFMAGSTTVSNMLFALFQYTAAGELGLPHAVITGVQTVGASLGNMICVHNIIAACATVGLIGVEGLIVKRNLIPLFITVLIAGAFTMWLTYSLL
jgi:lactate permease